MRRVRWGFLPFFLAAVAVFSATTAWVYSRIPSLHSDPVTPVQSQNEAKATKSYSGTEDNGSLWDETSSLGDLPTWMQDYFEWHAEQRKTLSENSDHKLLVLRCLRTDRACGGLSDRLKPLPFLIRLAATSNRLFLIAWTRPAPLETYLEPNLLDWTPPTWLNVGESSPTSRLYTHAPAVIQGVSKNTRVVSVRLQDQHGESSAYNELVGEERAHRKVFRSLWMALFRPTPPIRSAVKEQLQSTSLVPNQFVAAHLRANYGPSFGDKLEAVTSNAVQCARRLAPGLPILFASDSNEARRMMSTSVIVLPTTSQPLHLDTSDIQPPRAYDPTFVDLYLLASARCLSHGQGGFGRLAVLLSFNASCFFTYVKDSRVIEC